jgi:hypothetical protein
MSPPRSPCHTSKSGSSRTVRRATPRSSGFAAARRSSTRKRELLLTARLRLLGPNIGRLLSKTPQRWSMCSRERPRSPSSSAGISKPSRPSPNGSEGKQTHLEFLERHALGKSDALTLTSATLIAHVRARRADGTGAATVANDLIWVGVVLRAAQSVKELPVRPEVVQEARNACRALRLIGKPRKRSRRPTADELARLRDDLRAGMPARRFTCSP